MSNVSNEEAFMGAVLFVGGSALIGGTALWFALGADTAWWRVVLGCFGVGTVVWGAVAGAGPS